MAASRHLGFDPTGNGTVRSAAPENPTLEPNTGDRMTRCSYGHLNFFPKCVNMGPEVGYVGRSVGRQYSYF